MSHRAKKSKCRLSGGVAARGKRRYTVSMKYHENYRELVWVLARTDFKLRYQGSALGYLWAILKPLLMFLILNFVFSSFFNPRNSGIEHYSLQLLIGIILFNFFSEGTGAGMASLLSKSQLVTKIYVPRWTIIVAATLNSAMIFLMNLLVIAVFFAAYRFFPQWEAITLFLVGAVLTFALIVSFSLLTAPLFVRFRDLAPIWEVLLQVLFYASPIIYPLQMLPTGIQRVLLINPMAFIIHFVKESLANGHYPELWQSFAFLVSIACVFCLCVMSYRRLAPRIAEDV